MNILILIVQVILIFFLIIASIPILFIIWFYVNLRNRMNGNKEQNVTDTFREFITSRFSKRPDRKKRKENNGKEDSPIEFEDADYRELH